MSEIIRPKVAIIGTAGRDKTKVMSHALWAWMLKDAQSRIREGAHLVSGGAAWADHLAVALFLSGHATKLTLHLPAPLDEIFLGPAKSSASAANYYHGLFSKVLGRNTLEEIEMAARRENCDGTVEPYANGYGGMFARNAKVAADADQMLAYTFGKGDEPIDGGTMDTWAKCNGQKLHITLPDLPF